MWMLNDDDKCASLSGRTSPRLFDLVGRATGPSVMYQEPRCKAVIRHYAYNYYIL